MQEILFHRVIDGAGTVAAFTVGVGRHRQRVLRKLEDMRGQGAPGDALEGAAAAVNDTADAVITRIEAAGRVEFADGAL